MFYISSKSRRIEIDIKKYGEASISRRPVGFLKRPGRWKIQKTSKTTIPINKHGMEGIKVVQCRIGFSGDKYIHRFDKYKQK